jgi:hypothetical protein
MVPVLLPVNFLRTMLQPICQSHVAMSKIDCVVATTSLRSNRVILREDQSHNLAQLYIVQKELNVDWVHGILGWSLRFVFDKVIFADHVDVRIFNVDATRTTKRDCYGSISREQSPPDALPQAFVWHGELRALDATQGSVEE